MLYPSVSSERGASGMSASPPLTGPAIDPTVYPSMVINGQVVERIGEAVDDDGRTVGHFVIRGDPAVAGQARSFGGPGLQSFGGRVVLAEYPPHSASHLVRSLLDATHEGTAPRSGLRVAARAILRSRLVALVAAEKAKGTTMASLAAEAIQAIMDAAPGDRIPFGAFDASPWRSSILPLVDPLRVDASPPGAVVVLGEVQASLMGGWDLVSLATFWLYADKHSMTPGGTFGAVDTVSEAGAWSPPLASRAEQNRMSINASIGPAWSRYLLDGEQAVNGHAIALDFVTYLRPGSPNRTEARASVTTTGLLG